MKQVFALLTMVIMTTAANAQSIGIGTTTPNASAQLDVVSTTKGLLIPRMTSAQRTAIASPVAGLMVYETTTSSFWFYNGSAWNQIGTGGVSPWTTSGTNIYNSNTGNVGIGTTTPNPSAQLDVSSANKGVLIPRMTSTQRTSIASPANGLMVYDSTTNRLYQYQNSTWRTLITNDYWVQSTTRNWVYNGTDSIGIGTAAPLDRLHVSNGNLRVYGDIFNTGNIGAGTTNPVYRLDVNGTTRVSGDVLIDDGYIRINNTTNSQNWHVNNSSALGGRLLFLQQGLERVIFRNDGNVGIGGDLPLTNNGFPNTKLHIETGQDAGLTSSNNGYLMLGPSTGANMVIDNNEIVARTGFTGTSTLYLQNNGGELFTGARFTIDKSNEALRLTGATPYINFTNNGSSTNGFISQTANSLFIGENNGKIQIDGVQVAIGAISNAAPAYKLTVTGKVICEEVKVKLSGAWPDYVFDGTHQLMPIEKLSQFIQTNKHLPNIPAAAVIEKEGLELGDMQKKMMEKIEELTLYIIELQKQVDGLKKAPK